MARIYVDRYTASIRRSDLYRVDLHLKNGDVIAGLEPRRLFPFSNKQSYITLLDENEKEVALVRDLSELDEDSVCALEECFAEYYLIPEITRMIDCISKNGTLTWVVETDRGQISFRIRNRQNDIKVFRGTGRIIIRDFNDNRYEIKDYNRLDRKSKYLLFSDL